MVIVTEIKAETTTPYSVTNRSDDTSNHTSVKRKVDTIQTKYCALNYEDKRNNVQNNSNLSTIYFVTTTHPRPEQIPKLIRYSHTLMHVPRLHWILVDENINCSGHVLRILKRSGLPFTLISSPQPESNNKVPFPRQEVPNRSAGVTWIRHHVKEGILYFGDDDNTYDLEFFNEIRQTKKLSMFPVGLVGAYGVSSPIANDGLVVSFFDSRFHHKTFAVDMAGFAVNIKHLKPTAEMPTKEGRLADHFLETAGFKIQDIEPLADNCTKVLVWQTKTERQGKVEFAVDFKQLQKLRYKCLKTLLDGLSEINVVKLIPRKKGKSKKHEFDI
ncbi:glycosyltransferase family 43 domain-containing protein [Phthorimaea operculella]|nr:glycosyltransferase family 43 domain-containing protein [Phthorimaea operculella]